MNKTSEHAFGEWKPLVTASGKHYRECACGEQETAGCAWDAGVVTKQPTHLETGVKRFTCTACKSTKTESIAKIAAHEWTSWTPNNDGKTHTHLCKCGASETKEHSFDAGVVTKQPTHYEEGVKTFTCTACKFTKTESIAKIAAHEWTEWAPNNDGKTHTHLCKCGASETKEHSFDAGVVTKQPTHYEEGVKTFTCTACKSTKTESIAKIAEHEWTEWSPNGDGTHTRACRCNANETKDCTYDAGVVTKEPTHYEEGIKTYTCTVCEGQKTEPIAKTPEHEWTEWSPNGDGTHTRACRCNANETKDCTYDAGVVTKEPTHFEEGIKTYTCLI